MKVKQYEKKDFAWTKWGAKEIKKLAHFLLEEKKKAYEKIKQILKKERTFDNTVRAIESSGDKTGDNISIIHLLMEVSPSKDTRETAKKVIDKFQKEALDVEFDEGIYKALKEYETGNFKKEKAKLDADDIKLFGDMLRDYKRMGFELDKKDQEKLKNNLKNIGSLGIRFSKNINDYEDHILLSENETAGLPASFLKTLKKDKDGRYIVTLDYPDFYPFMQNAENAKKRKELVDKSLKKGGKDNLSLVSKILKLREANAKLLGYKHHGDYKTETRMAKNADNVLRFLKDLLPTLSKEVKKEIKELADLKARITGDKKAKIEYYDLLYYSNLLKKEKFNIDNERVREFFPLEMVKNGTFEIYAKLFSVEFEKARDYPAWHKDAELYAVRDGGEIIAYFFMDMHPRVGKYGHFMATEVISGREDMISGEYVAPVACTVCNFRKSSKGSPSLLDHSEVETFFHEFGHVMHQVLTKARYVSQSGTSVTRDFVEAPSQMFEEWVWKEEALNLLSGHFKNNKEKLPKDILKNMMASKRHMIGYFYARQMVIALCDIMMHTGASKEAPNEVYNNLTEKYLHIKMPKGNRWLAGFGHFIGYDAGYYSYLWSKVYAMDMFLRFEKEGLLNTKTGADYRKLVLEKGSSEEEMSLVKNFLGRKPNNKIFLKEIGIIK
ncbi:MAG: M3 family metallopeptidase [bacterium]|nr:M3 family metallopeptidase [bacterium]